MNELESKRELSPSDIPLLPSKDFIMEFLKEVRSEGHDIMEVVRTTLESEVEKAKKELGENHFECTNERVIGLITLNAIEKALEIYGNIIRYQKDGDAEALDKAAEALDALLGLIRASPKAIPVRIADILEKCCALEESG